MAKEPKEPSDPSPSPTPSGTGGSTSNQPSGPWSGGTDVPHVRGGIHNDHPFAAPPVPGGDGTKGTSVDTPSMDRFAENIDRLIAPVMAAYQRLDTVKVAPGAFYDANKMRAAVAGAQQDGALKKSYSDALHALLTGLTDTRDGARKLSHDYGAGEDANKVTAKNLADAFDKVPGDFNDMMKANGGSGAPSTTGGSGSGSGGSGSGGSGSGGSGS
ncbi:hypothetical protein ACIBCP_35240 [Streptomyces sp. NPDC051287]|uniref:hypothetical protein n=1 Tax=unclassified Streptomyces TaxID=2593676 RepID=UPI0037B32BEE